MLLRGHEGQRADLVREPPAAEEHGGEPEVRELQPVAPRHHEVLRLDVPVADVPAVHRGHGGTHLQDPVGGLGLLHRLPPLLDFVCEVPAIAVLKDQVDVLGILEQSVKPGDVLVHGHLQQVYLPLDVLAAGAGACSPPLADLFHGHHLSALAVDPAPHSAERSRPEPHLLEVVAILQPVLRAGARARPVWRRLAQACRLAHRPAAGARSPRPSHARAGRA
mmetsp:Transcript_53506/g.142088  ORF Transcript_53506/g.142088 Transcript_53506/m.142088 type:complete len:221 (-) Transcript_53506:7-669(-)